MIKLGPNEVVHPFVDPEGKLNLDDLRKIARLTIAEGLMPGFIFPVEFDDIEVKSHFEETYPPRFPQDYLGREHLRYIGEQMGLDARVIGRLSNSVMYPVKAEDTSVILHPSSLGLVIASRQEVGMATPEFRIAETSLTQAQRLHLNHHDGNKISPTASVAQAEGLLNLSRNPQLMAAVYGLHTLASQRDFAAITYRLGQLVSA